MELLPVIIDVAFIAVVIANVLDGRKRGFVRIALSLAAAFVSWIIASEYAQPVAIWANESFVHGWISGSIENAIASHLGGGTSELIEAIPDYIANAAELAGISLQNLALQLNSAVDSAEAAEQIYTAIEGAFVIPAIKIVVFFIIYAISNAILSIGINMVNTIFRLPVIKSFNKLLGGAAGAAKGILIIGVISIALSFLTMVAPETPFAQAISQSAIQQFLSDAIKALFA